jgi:hypothetical protein
MKHKVWNLQYMAGNTGRHLSDGSNPQRRTEVLAAARKVAESGWRVWVEHHTTGKRIFESESEQKHRHSVAAKRIVQFAIDNVPGFVAIDQGQLDGGEKDASMCKYQLGQVVRLVPTQGSYQKEHEGTVTSVTATQIGVTRVGGSYEVRFRSDDGMPIKKSDRGFPCYVVKA